MKWYLKVLQNYAVFTGRARRKEYWMFSLFNFIIAFALSLFITLVTGGRFILLLYLYDLAVLVPGIAVSVRRMHDVNKSGWFLLVPIYNLILACTPGTAGENNYGDDPKSNGPTFDFEKTDAVTA